MSHDIFVREVNEELRQDRVKAMVLRYGAIALGAAILIVLAVGGYVLYERYRAGLEAADGDRMIAAASLVAEDKTDEARTILEGLVSDGTGIYPELARMRLAEIAQKDDPAGAVARFDEVAADSAAPQGLRDMAAIRAAYILVDTGSLSDVRQRVERLTSEAEPLRYPAREAVALAAWKAGDVDTARPLLTQLQDDLGTPQGIKRRATLLLELIAASTEAPASETPAAPASPGGEDAPTGATDAPAPADAPAAPAPADAPAAPAPSAPAAPATPPAAPAPAQPTTPAAPAPAPSETPAAAPQPPA